jgi:peptidoglycan hydrolase-like protein with peptidoglycan-binding domain
MVKEPLEIPKDESEYLARKGRKSKKGVAFQWGANDSEQEKVRHLQEALKSLDYRLPKYGVDGLFGPETTRAVRAFQRKHKDPLETSSQPLLADGIVGPKTAVALNGALARDGLWFKEYRYEWSSKEGNCLSVFTSGKKTKLIIKKNQENKVYIGGDKMTEDRTGLVKAIKLAPLGTDAYGWGWPGDFLDTEVIVEMDVESWSSADSDAPNEEVAKEVYGLKLRNDSKGQVYGAMLDLLILAYKTQQVAVLQIIRKKGRHHHEIASVELRQNLQNRDTKKGKIEDHRGSPAEPPPATPAPPVPPRRS